MSFKPNLAATIDPMKEPDVFSKIMFPVVVSPKLDGIRAVNFSGSLVSRTLKRFPRHRVYELFADTVSLDGELIVGEPTDNDVYNRTQSYVMSGDERPEEDLRFYVFDVIDTDAPFEERMLAINDIAYSLGNPRIKVVPQVVVRNLEQLLEIETAFLEQGYEGIMVRSTTGKYKFGRSTMKEQGLMKLKRFSDDEAIVIGFVEQMTNTNEAEEDALGHTKRSSCKSGMVPAGTLGKLIADYNGVELQMSCGTMSHAERKKVWDNQCDYLGKTFKFRHFAYGAKDLPRLGRFIGWRDLIDM